MKRSISAIVLIFLTLALVACAPSSKEVNTDVKKSVETPPISAAPPVSELPAAKEEKIPLNEKTEFSILIKDGWITLGKYDADNQLTSLLGKATKKEVEIITNADTFNGSFLKKLSYEGLDLTYMSPKDDGKKFWLLEARLTNPKYITLKGIKVGDSLSDLIKVYPKVEIVLDGRTDKSNCAYSFSSTETLEHINFEVKDGKITEIKLYKELL
jgi:hypothetical protein